jgi:hypothetical protein
MIANIVMNKIELATFHTLIKVTEIPILDVIRTIGNIVTIHDRLVTFKCRGFRIHDSNLS